MVKIIQRRVKHAKVLPCVFFIPLRMRVRDNIIILYTEVDSKQNSHSQPLYFKGIQSPVPSLFQGILFVKIVMFARLYTAIRREATVNRNNRTRDKAACVIVRKPHKRADKVGNFTKLLHRRRRKDFTRSCRRCAVFVE